jgi:hypothetical protein
VDRERWSWAGVLRTLIVAGLLGLLTVVLLWPAIWVAPERTLLEAIDFTLATSSEHRPGNFFLGQAVADPGPIFYPVAIVFRLAPLTLAGLVAVGVLLPPRSMKAPSLLLLLYIAGFLLFLTIPSKKLDRYALPVFPALGLLAGVGFWTLGTWLVQAARRRWPDLHRAAIAVPIGLLALGQVMPLLMVAPYPLAYYNPLMGGAPAATRVMLVGWGEGLDQVAAYLNAQPNASRQRIAIYFPLVLNFAGMVEGSVSQIGATRPVDYVVDYVNATQRGQTPGVVASQTPDLVVRINGVVYARVFKVSPARPAF